MTILSRISATLASVLFLFLVTGMSPYLLPQLHFFNTAEAGELACVSYDEAENTISVSCNASFIDVVQAINDPDLIENQGNGEYLQNANLQVVDGVTFQMTSNGDGLQYLKLAGENGIIVYGTILIDGVKITSWDPSDEDVIQQDMNGTIRRGYIQFAASEGSQITNSEFGYLGDEEPGRRGFDLFGGGGPSHDMVIRGSKFHDMWMAFYSKEAYNIVVDGNEYYNNIKYALDPHTATHDMKITNNWIHDNYRYGAICSDDCYNILIEGNLVEHNSNAGIFFSRNMTDSIARYNHIVNARTGVLLSESSNNQIYNNTIEGATGEGIGLLNPDLTDDGVTEGNLVYNNRISNSGTGVSATRSQNNIVENTTFSGIESGEFRIFGEGSALTIKGQYFDNTLISVGGSETGVSVEIVDSGTIQVTEGAGDEEEGDEGNGDGESETQTYNTNNEPFRMTLSDGDSITVTSTTSAEG